MSRKQFDIMDYALVAGFLAVATSVIPWSDICHAIFG